MAKLWQKSYDVDAVVEAFTTGRDYMLDHDLLVADALGSIAHAWMLGRIELLSAREVEGLTGALRDVLSTAAAGDFRIRPEDEDGHTAIENVLVERLGEVGKKIHTGRSRNDQVLTALRLYGRARASEIMQGILELSETMLNLAERYADQPLPGRTHMQPAMPSSLGLWFGAFGEDLLDDARLLQRAVELTDRCPLGSAASYGVPLPLDRAYVSDLLGFCDVHNNVLAANNSRGKGESMVLDALDHLGLTLAKIATDLIFFSLPEVGYVTLPPELTTGSSIMPQKKNPDVLELLRGRAASLGGYAAQIKSVIRALPSGYNRDFQETKEPFLRGLEIAAGCVSVLAHTLPAIEVHPDRIAASFQAGIFATDVVFERVKEGRSFRDAYRYVGEHLDELDARDPAAALATRQSLGSPGKLNLQAPREVHSSLLAWLDGLRTRVEPRLAELAGGPVSVTGAQ